jgi:hypothetical protein
MSGASTLAVNTKKRDKITTLAIHATANLGISDFDFLEDAAFGGAAVFLCGVGF